MHQKSLLRACNDDGPMVEIQGRETPSLEEQPICVTNFLKILDNWTKKTLLTPKRKNIFAIEH